jgi:hypothetical protein
VVGTNFQGADLRLIPWSTILELTLQPGVNFTGILWSNPLTA